MMKMPVIQGREGWQAVNHLALRMGSDVGVEQTPAVLGLVVPVQRGGKLVKWCRSLR